LLAVVRSPEMKRPHHGASARAAVDALAVV